MRHRHTVVVHPIHGDGESGEPIAEASASGVAASLNHVVGAINDYLLAHRDELEFDGSPVVARIELSLTWKEAPDA